MTTTRDMLGKTVLITGANAGIGRATALALASRGATVYASGRRAEALDEAVRAIREEAGSDAVHPLVADLASLDDVRRLAAALRERTDRLDVLINNAGLAVDTRRESADGHELTVAVNLLAPFLLSLELLPLLRAAEQGRVVSVSSANHVSLKKTDVDRLLDSAPYRWGDAYARSKLGLILATRALSRRLEGTGVTANSLHPGVIATSFGDDGDLTGLGGLAFRLMKYLLPGPARGARTSVYLATDPGLATTSGLYFSGERAVSPSRLAQDDALGEALWARLEEMVGVRWEDVA
ncbi:MAG: SDR family NAD(P)-dependent oxidoreductase [Deltaproteobacteria bacterium]|nr:SDR family NAD(P)-dependent oxidoreductase [Deltaproteobacteria bacterium]